MSKGVWEPVRVSVSAKENRHQIKNGGPRARILMDFDNQSTYQVRKGRHRLLQIGITNRLGPAMNRGWLKFAATLFAIAHFATLVGCFALAWGEMFRSGPDPYSLLRPAAGYLIMVLMLPLGWLFLFFPGPLFAPLQIANSIFWGVMIYRWLQEWIDGPLPRNRLLPQSVDLPENFGTAQPPQAEGEGISGPSIESPSAGTPSLN